MTKSGFDLDEIERLLAAATPGEWQHHCSHVYGPDHERQLVCQFRNAPWLVADRDLTVALHNSAPAMIAAIRELRAENARLREAMDEDGLTEIITDTLDMDWQPRWAAQAIRRAALGEPQ